MHYYSRWGFQKLPGKCGTCGKPVKEGKAVCYPCHVVATKAPGPAKERIASWLRGRRHRSQARSARYANRTWWEGDKLMQVCDYFGSCEMPCNGDC